MKVYDGNWSAKNREQLIKRIKKCVCEMDTDTDVIVKIFENLKPKIQKASKDGPQSLVK